MEGGGGRVGWWWWSSYVFSTFSSIFITFHEGTRQPGGVGYVIDERILKEMHYTGWDRRFGYDIRKCPIYRGRYMRGFFIGIIVRRDRDLSFSTV